MSNQSQSYRIHKVNAKFKYGGTIIKNKNKKSDDKTLRMLQKFNVQI